MSIILSRGCEYALQAMIYLASQPQDSPILQRDIALALNIPPYFLGKILQLLSHSGLVNSYKGKRGGFILAKPLEEISLYDVVVALDGASFLHGCILGFPGCDDKTPCPVHTQWKTLRQNIIDMLQKESISSLEHDIQPKLEFIKTMAKKNMAYTKKNRPPQ
jgi:Rrf2 family protein